MKKTLLSAGFVLMALFASAQCSDLFFSEYLEGSSNNKAIEIYNPTAAAINLSDYVFYRYNNGSPTPTDSLFPQDIIAPGDVWVAGNPSAVAGILSESDTLHTITFFNGDDALSLKKISTNTVLDIIGLIGNDPGTNWPVGTGATSEFTLVRMIGIQQGNVTWATAANEYDVFPQNTLTSIGNHTMTPCCSAPTLALQTQVDVTCFGGSNGSISVTATGNGPFTYAWTNRPETTSSISGIPAGTYTVTATGVCGTDTMTFTLTEPTAVDAQINSQINPTCFGSTDGSVSVVASGGTPGYTYLWSSGGTNAVENGLGDGSYLVTVTDANGCTGFTGATITQPAVLTQSLTASIPPGCNMADGSLTITPSGGTAPYTYMWSNGSITSAINNLSAGLYSCTVTCSNGCTSVENYTLNNQNPPVVTVSLAMDTLCLVFSGPFVLNGETPAGGVWSGNGVNGSTFYPDSVNVGWHVITYTYTDSSNCIGIATDSVFVDICGGISGNVSTMFSLFPNPFTETIQLQFATPRNVISVYNMQGEIVYSETTNSLNSTIDLRSLATGIYTLKVENESGVSVKKIQKAE